jgi:hypothetical protein
MASHHQSMVAHHKSRAQFHNSALNGRHPEAANAFGLSEHHRGQAWTHEIVAHGHLKKAQSSYLYQSPSTTAKKSKSSKRNRRGAEKKSY